MIEEIYVSFDTARMLNEAGFDLSCRGVHVILKEVNTPHRIIIRKEYFKKNFAKKFQQ